MLASAAFACRLVWLASGHGEAVWAAIDDLVVLGPLGVAGLVLWWISVAKAMGPVAFVASGVSVAVFVSSVVVTGVGVPVRARFVGSRAAFEAVVAQADAQLPARPASARWLQKTDFPIPCPHLVGHIRIASCQAFWTSRTHGYTFVRAWGYPVGDDLGIAGIDYRPDARAAGTLNDHLVGESLTQLGGPWFNWAMPD